MSEPQAAVAAGQITRLERIAARRARLGNLLSEKIAGTPGILPHQVHPEDRAVYWFYFLRMRSGGVPLQSGGVRPGPAGRRDVRDLGRLHQACPLYGEPVFQQHGFFAGRWPVKDLGLTTMDYSKQHCPEAEAILKTGIRISIHEDMSEDYILAAAAAIKKVAHYYAV